VIGNEGGNFCVGANLGEMAEGAKNGDLDEIGEAIDALQNLLMDFRFASKPVVAAPHGQTLGAGAEICLHADRICAAGETYVGLVETGVGLIPAGGGTKELARRLVSSAMHPGGVPPLPHVQEAFEQIALAKVSGSALEAKEMGFLRDEDRVVMNGDHLISAAKREALDLADGYAPPVRENSVYAAGTKTRAALEVDVNTMQWGNFATEYDGVIAGHLARVLTGGDLSIPQWVSEEHILKLEKEAFLELLKNDKTLERIDAMLKTGKPLRN
jgi:3-hydroxyacyl-CoA dehydrogenase